MKLKELRSFSNLQKKIFASAVRLVRRDGGVVVYSTCTFTVEENEGLVVWALEKFPQLKLVEATPILGQPGIDVTKLFFFVADKKAK
jgi:16S rRNA C967 or C1407 C5-methylase (RsmB/RsmF family)